MHVFFFALTTFHWFLKKLVFLGVNRLCRDIEFMISVKPGIYWRVCWAFLTPIMMFTILIYTFISYKPLKYKDQAYPEWATGEFLSVFVFTERSWPFKMRKKKRKWFNVIVLFSLQFSYRMDCQCDWYCTVATLGRLLLPQTPSQRQWKVKQSN